MRTPILVAASTALMTACGDPFAGVDKLSDVAVAEDAPTRGAVAATEDADGGDGFLSGLFRARPAGIDASAGMNDPASVEAVEESAAVETLGTQDAAQPKPRGLLARLFNPSGGTSADDGVETAALAQDVAAVPAPSQDRSRYGRGGTRPGNPGGPDRSQDVPHGSVMPFAAVGRVCDAPRRAMGKRVERSDAGYDLYDTAPSSPHPRTFYITGFADGCPRQFTAALAMFGAPSMHEQLRYGRPSGEYPYSDTDKAYERVKSAICGVGRRKPCGSRIGSLERNTVFISTYERFTDNGRWADILVHDGAVLAASLKDP